MSYKKIFNSNELDVNSTTEKISVVQTEGDREVNRTMNFYNLDAVISVGYRVNSLRATQVLTMQARFPRSMQNSSLNQSSRSIESFRIGCSNLILTVSIRICWNFRMISKSSRRKTKVGFPPTFVFRPLTPPYMRVRIRRFLTSDDTFRSIPSMTDSLLARGFYCSLRLALLRYLPLPSSPCSRTPIDRPSIAVFRI